MPVGNNASPLQTVICENHRMSSPGLLRFWLVLLLLISSAACLAQGASDKGAEFLYAVENPCCTVSSIEAFQIDTNTGSLTPLSSPMVLSSRAQDIVVDRKSKFLFVGESTPFSVQPTVTSFGIDDSGTLALASQIALPGTNDTLTGLALDRTGTNLYASATRVLSEGSVSPLTVDRDSGTVAVLGPGPGNQLMPGRLYMHPSGQFLYASLLTRHHHPSEGGYDLYLRDPQTGTLTYPNKQFRTQFFPEYEESAFVSHGRFLVGVGRFVHSADVFSVNTDTGDLTVSSRLPGDFRGVAADRTGSFVVLAGGDGNVASYAVNDDGSLTQAGAATAVPNVSTVILDESNRFVYIKSPGTAQIFAYTFDAETGALGSVAGSPFTMAGTPIRMATAAPKK